MNDHQLIRLCSSATLIAAMTACSTIPTGRTGVEWTPTHGTMNRTLNEGFHFVSPFSRIYEVDLREQQHDEDLDVLADNGLEIKMTSSILFQPIDGQAFDLIRETEPEYYGTLIGPYVRSSARRVVGRYSSEEIYSTKHEQIEREIRDDVGQNLEGRHLRINAILIREVHLPAVVQTAIQAKLQEEQKALEMRFVLDRTRQEAERKRIEAAGIADYQATISKGLTDRIISSQGIEATEKLAESANAKVVVIGGGKGGLPVILNAASSGGETASP